MSQHQDLSSIRVELCDAITKRIKELTTEAEAIDQEATALETLLDFLTEAPKDALAQLLALARSCSNLPPAMTSTSSSRSHSTKKG